MNRDSALSDFLFDFGSNMPRSLVVALWRLGAFPQRLLSDFAVRELEAGSSSEDLIRLAGLIGPAAESESPQLFEKYLSDVPSIRDEDAVMQFAVFVAEKILREEVAPYAGAAAIWAVVQRLQREFHALDGFIYAASEMEDRPWDAVAFADGIKKEARSLLMRVENT